MDANACKQILGRNAERFAIADELLDEGVGRLLHGGSDFGSISATPSRPFMRLAPSVNLAHASGGMATATQIREWLNHVLQTQHVSVEQWAQRAGVAKSTIFRALKPDYEFVTSSRTLSKLADAVGIDPPGVFKEQVRLEPRFLPVRYRVQAGLWFELDTQEPPEQTSLAVVPDRRFASFSQWLERVEGDSADLAIPSGHYVHVIDAVEMGYAAQDGDWVIVERRRDQGAVRERTIKQVEIRDGRVKLWPRSRNPKWSEPVDLTNGARPHDVEAEIVGLVVGAYNPTLYAR